MNPEYRPPTRPAQPPIATPDDGPTRYYLAEAARSELAATFARFYAPLSIACMLMPFFPLFDKVRIGDDGEYEYGTIFTMMRRSGGGAAVIAFVLMIALVTLLITATFRTSTAALPAVIAVIAALLALLLVTKPGAYNSPHLSATGRADLIVLVSVVTLAAAHAVSVLIRCR